MRAGRSVGLGDFFNLAATASGTDTMEAGISW